MEISLGIIGTAGRKDDSDRLSIEHFKSMCVVADGLINQCKENNYIISTLVSGGAAWADYIAVKLFLDKKAPKLKLFLPAKWNNGAFHENGDPKYPGATSNYYHRKFSKQIHINSLSQMQMAKCEGAEFIEVDKGFYARNYLVAKSSDFLLACTFGDKNMVKDGGTANCMRCYLNRVKKEDMFDKSFHYNLSDGTLYIGAKVPNEVPQLQKK